MAKVIIPLPSRDFDPSEVAVSWQILNQDGHQVFFATPDGKPASADPLMLTGEGLDLWGLIPGLKRLKVIGLLLRANVDARKAYSQLVQDKQFNAPFAYADLRSENFEGLVLPGGHWARGMRFYLEDLTLQKFVAEFFDERKPVGAICHGVVLAARSVSSLTGKSSLYGLKTTALTWGLENSAWSMMKVLGRVWDPNYYRTYMESGSEPVGYRGVQAEVERALRSPTDFLDVPKDEKFYFRKTSGIFRDRDDDERPSFVVQDGNYVSARWPGDVHCFAKKVSALLRTFER